MHDERHFPRPFSFDPQRFMKSETGETQLDPRKYAFGFGARTCPGKPLHDA